MKTALDAIIIIDNSGLVKEFNPAAERIFGYKRNETVGKELAELIIPPAYRAAHRRGLRRYLETGQGAFIDRRIEVTALRKSGEEFPVELTIARIGHSQPPIFMGTVRDISEGQRARQELATSEQRYRFVVENTSDIITVLDEKGIIRYQSPSVMRILGVDKPHEGSSIFKSKLVHPDDARVKSNFLLKLIKAAPEAQLKTELRMRHADGSWRDFEIVGTNLLHMPDIGGIVLSSRDISERKQAERALAASENRFRTLIEQSADGIQLVSPDGTVLYSSESVKNVTGYRPEEIQGETAKNHIHPDDWPLFKKKLETLLKHPHKPQTLQYRVRHKNGEWIWVETTGTNHLKTPNVNALVGNFRNITERKRAEQALKDSEQRLLSAQAAGNVGIFDWNMQENQITYSQQAEIIFGFKPGQFSRASYEGSLEILHPDDRARIKNESQAAIKNHRELDLEYRIIRPDKSVRWLSVRATCSYDSKGRPEKLLGTIMDITERKQAEQAQARIVAIVESSDDAIVSMDLSGVVQTWNKGAERLFGLSEKKIAGRSIKTIIPKDRSTEEDEILARVRSGKKIEHFETVRCRKDGSLIDVSLTVSPIRDSTGRVIGASKTARDITERKRAEAALRRSEAEYRRLVDLSPEGIAIHSGGKLIYANRAAAKIIGARSPKDLVGQPLLKFVHPDYIDAVKQRASQLINDGGSIDLLEEKFIRLDGSVIDVEVAAIGLRFAGKPAVQVLVRDISERNKAAADLKKSEERLAAITAASPVALWMTDRDGGIIYVNQTWLNWTGRPLKDQLGRGWRSSVIKESVDPETVKLENAAKKLSNYRTEFKIRDRSGRERWLDVRGKPYFDDKGEYAGYSGSASDITSRKAEEQQLLKSKERESFLLDLADKLRPLSNAKKIIHTAAKELGEYLQISSAGYIIVDKTEQYASVIGEWSSGAMPSLAIQNQRVENSDSELSRQVRRGKIIASSDVTIDSRLADPAEQARYKSLNLRSFVVAPLIKQGVVPGYFYLAHSEPRAWDKAELDLTHEVAERAWAALRRAAAENELRESEKRYRTLFNTIDEGFCVVEIIHDSKGRPVDFRFHETNQAFKDLTGMKDANGAAVGQEAAGLDPSWLQIFDLILKTGQPTRFETEVKILDSWFEAYAFRAGDVSQNQVGVLLTDIKERKRLEQQKDDFIAVTSHELKTPVTSMKVYASLLGRRFSKNGDELAASMIGKLDSQLNRLNNLVRELLDITKIEAGQPLALNYSRFDLRSVVEETVGNLALTTSDHRITVSGGHNISIESDRDRVIQILTNLIDNAIKYSPGHPEVKVSLRKDSNGVIVCVADRGLGISKEQQEHLFERFVRVGGKTTANYPGLGLGLYVCSQLIESLGGSIWVKSSFGKGSRFYFSLPVARRRQKA